MSKFGLFSQIFPYLDILGVVLSFFSLLIVDILFFILLFYYHLLKNGIIHKKMLLKI